MTLKEDNLIRRRNWTKHVVCVYVTDEDGAKWPLTAHVEVVSYEETPMLVAWEAGCMNGTYVTWNGPRAEFGFWRRLTMEVQEAYMDERS